MAKERDSAILWVVAGLGVVYLLSKSGSAQGCTAGDTQTQTCSDGSTIITSTCTGGQWINTGNQCPSLGCSAEITGSGVI